MVDNIVGIGVQAFWIGLSACALILFAVFLALRNRSQRTPPGGKGHRSLDTKEAEPIRADGYIDSFANEIEEAGGGLTPLIWIVIILVLSWWGLYILLYWNPR